VLLAPGAERLQASIAASIQHSPNRRAVHEWLARRLSVPDTRQATEAALLAFWLAKTVCSVLPAEGRRALTAATPSRKILAGRCPDAFMTTIINLPVHGYHL